jgi:hypothetical protein
MSDLWDWICTLPAVVGILAGALLATLGWIHTARRQRALSCKQHTFNALLQASFNQQYQHALNKVRPHLRAGNLPDLNLTENATLKDDVIFLLNHYEFLAAGIRNGDISERLLKDSEKSTVLHLYKTCEKLIHNLRDSRNRRTSFEHIEWLHDRWAAKRPGLFQAALEWLAQRPLYHSYHQWLVLGGAVVVLLLLATGWAHLPQGDLQAVRATMDQSVTE